MSGHPGHHASLAGHPVPLSRDARRALTTELFAELAGSPTPGTARTQELHERLVLANAQVAMALARRFRGRGIDLDDLEQTAYVALVGAVRKYDSGRGSDFMVYAVPTITGELKRHFRDHGWTIRVPRRIQETQRRLDADGSATLVGERYDNDRLRALATRLATPVSDICAALTARGCFTPASLDLAVGGTDGPRLGDLLPAEDSPHDAADLRMTLGPVYAQLSPRDRRILRLRYIEEHSQQEIGDELGITQAQVSRLLIRIHRDMRRQLDVLSAS